MPGRRVGYVKDRFTRRPVDEVLASALLFYIIVHGFNSLRSRPNIVQGIGVMIAAGVILTAPRRSLSKLWISVPALLVMSVWLLSVSWGESQVHWIAETRPEVLGISFAMIAVSRLSAEMVVKTSLACMYFVVAQALVEPLINSGAIESNGWKGNFIHKNQLGAFMAMLILSALLLENRKLVRQIVVLVAFGLVLLSRSATGLAMALSVPVIIATLRTYATGARREGVAKLLALVVGLGALVFAATTQSDTVLGAYGKDSTLTGRTEIWSAALPEIAENPITGYGPGIWLERATGPAFEIFKDARFITAHAHNSFIEILLTFGIIGLTAWLILLVATARAGFKLIDVRPEIGMWVVGYTILWMLWSISENGHTGGFIWFMVVLHVLATREVHRADEDRQPRATAGSRRRALASADG